MRKFSPIKITDNCNVIKFMFFDYIVSITRRRWNNKTAYIVESSLTLSTAQLLAEQSMHQYEYFICWTITENQIFIKI